MGGVATLEQLLAEGAATVEGDLAILGQLAGLMVEFDPRFEIMPGTKALTEAVQAEALEADIGAVIPNRSSRRLKSRPMSGGCIKSMSRGFVRFGTSHRRNWQFGEAQTSHEN